MKHLLFIVVVVAALVTAGCVGQNQNAAVATPQPTLQAPANTPAMTPQATAAPAPSLTYNKADFSVLNSNPAYGFTMDYPSNWTGSQQTSNTWGGFYRFSSPDRKSGADVYIDDTGGAPGTLTLYQYPLGVQMSDNAGSGTHMYPLDTPTQNSQGVWTDNIIKGLTAKYCLDGAGNPVTCGSGTSGSSYLYRRLVSNDPVSLSGYAAARKLVFAPDARDTQGSWSTYYLLHAGTIQGYNFTVPGHYEVAHMVNGPVWDYGMGGHEYAIVLYTDQVDASRDVFDHMIKSFQVTP
jgi:hypothetical protein